MIKDRQLGRVKVAAPLVHSAEITEAFVMMGFLPIRVEYIWEYDYYMYTGISHLFAAVPEGRKIPLYDITVAVDYTDDGEVTGPIKVTVEAVPYEKEDA